LQINLVTLLMKNQSKDENCTRPNKGFCRKINCKSIKIILHINCESKNNLQNELVKKNVLTVKTDSIKRRFTITAVWIAFTRKSNNKIKQIKLFW